MRVKGAAPAAATALLMASSVFSQDAQNVTSSGTAFQERHPDASEITTQDTQPQPTYRYFSILAGVPQIFELHHDTEAKNGKPIDEIGRASCRERV